MVIVIVRKRTREPQRERRLGLKVFELVPRVTSHPSLTKNQKIQEERWMMTKYVYH